MTDDATVGPPLIPGFRYQADLGHGGFADVYRYEQESLGRSVAIKVMHGLSRPAAASFKAESLVMARLSNHPSVVSIYQVGTADDGRPYLVMQLCPPPHLGTQLRKRPFSVAETLDVGIRLAGAVESAHDLGVLHRDIKPANILFTEFRNPVLADFGIARAADHDTTIKAFSPAWAPPEQMRGAPATPAVDIYSLCATLWAMLLGHEPFDNLEDKTDRIPTELPERVPPALSRLLRSGLAARPEHRPASALELARQLQRIQTSLGRPITPVELWDGQGTQNDLGAQQGTNFGHSPTLVDDEHPRTMLKSETILEQTTPDDRTHLVSLSSGPATDSATDSASDVAAAGLSHELAPVASLPPVFAHSFQPNGEFAAAQRSTPRGGLTRWALPLAVLAIVALSGLIFGLLYTSLRSTPTPTNSPTGASSTKPNSTPSTGTPAPSDSMGGSWNG